MSGRDGGKKRVLGHRGSKERLAIRAATVRTLDGMEPKWKLPLHVKLCGMGWMMRFQVPQRSRLGFDGIAFVTGVQWRQVF